MMIDKEYILIKSAKGVTTRKMIKAYSLGWMAHFVNGVPILFSDTGKEICRSTDWVGLLMDLEDLDLPELC